ncbi:hypothetical protein N7510_007789 [Penicillium lagena]|uniref:uncharacterized protein n=1 Tax=Penicillium lagena TaxID=94218 RepID=UPI0025420565|nr:uncharacterized protein N7510_007789 [Penicillium lagena]KAJ5611070.1 hypothetical protein N7510_007789 [Penicillium lagena]
MTDRKAHNFLPGDVVSGKVILSAKGDEKIKDISITFKGSLFAKSTEGNFRDTYNFDIFRLSETLLQGPAKMAASTYEYPFFFEIPKNFFNPVAWEGFSKPGDLYSSPLGPMWPIPPTCEDASQLRDSYTDWKVTYSLAAQAKKSMLSLGDELPIVVTCEPTRNPSPAQQEARDSFTQHYTFTNSGIPKPLTKAKPKDITQHGAGNYQLSLSLVAAPMTAVIIGEPFTLAFTLQINSPESDYRMPLPEFQLKDYTIILRSSTTTGVPHEKKAFLSSSVLSPLALSPDKYIVNAPLRPNEPVLIHETLPSPFKSTPSFKTVLLERRYFFQIHAHVSCLDNTANLKILLPFWLHAPKVQEI